MRTEQARYTPSAKHCEPELAICRLTPFISRDGKDPSQECRQSTDPVLCEHRQILVLWITCGARPPIRWLILFGDVFRIGLSESAGADAKQPMVFENLRRVHIEHPSDTHACHIGRLGFMLPFAYTGGNLIVHGWR